MAVAKLMAPQKSLDDIQNDMAELYNSLKDGNTDRVQASELANIAGKWLKAEQLKLAKDIFLHSLQRRQPGQPQALGKRTALRVAMSR